MGNPTLHDTTIDWLSSLHLVFGSTQKANDWIKRLAALEPLLLDSMVPVGERVASGEVPLGVAYVKYVHLWSRKGAPMDYVKGLPVYLGDGNYIGLTAKAPHPNAAKLYIDYFLGQESSEIMANVGEFVNRSGVYPPGTNLEAALDGREHVYLPQASAERTDDYELVRFREMIRES
jgi:iron(III) transport system substrate-binding protein